MLEYSSVDLVNIMVNGCAHDGVAATRTALRAKVMATHTNADEAARVLVGAVCDFAISSGVLECGGVGTGGGGVDGGVDNGGGDDGLIMRRVFAVALLQLMVDEGDMQTSVLQGYVDFDVLPV